MYKKIVTIIILVALLNSAEVRAMPLDPITTVSNSWTPPKTTTTVPAWLQPKLPAMPTGSFFSGGGNVNTGMSGYQVPKWTAFNQPYKSVFDQPMTLTPPDPNGPMPFMPNRPQRNQFQVPDWISKTLASPQNPYTLFQPKPPTTTYAHPTSTGGNETAAPTSSVLASNNEQVLGQNQQAYPITPPVNGSFLAGGGTIAQGPGGYMFNQLSEEEESPFATSYGGWGNGYGYGRRRYGGGGGGGGGYPQTPAWWMNLNSWNVAE